jgi:hypothetical protein
VNNKPRRGIWLAVILLAIGLFGHVLAAQAMGGSRVAYTHHIIGFFIILLVTGVLIGAVGWRFWKDRSDIMLITIGAVQAVLGVLVYLKG